MMIDINDVVRLVDNWKDRCPGKVEQKNLLEIGIQKERRILKRLFKKVKHIIYLQEGTENIWYKNDECSTGVVKMGFSLKRLSMHPSSVPMEFYNHVFMYPSKLIPIKFLREQDQDTLKLKNMTGYDWLKLNDFELQR